MNLEELLQSIRSPAFLENAVIPNQLGYSPDTAPFPSLGYDIGKFRKEKLLRRLDDLLATLTPAEKLVLNHPKFLKLALRTYFDFNPDAGRADFYDGKSLRGASEWHRKHYGRAFGVSFPGQAEDAIKGYLALLTSPTMDQKVRALVSKPKFLNYSFWKPSPTLTYVPNLTTYRSYLFSKLANSRIDDWLRHFLSSGLDALAQISPAIEAKIVLGRDEDAGRAYNRIRKLLDKAFNTKDKSFFRQLLTHGGFLPVAIACSNAYRDRLSLFADTSVEHLAVEEKAERSMLQLKKLRHTPYRDNLLESGSLEKAVQMSEPFLWRARGGATEFLERVFGYGTFRKPQPVLLTDASTGILEKFSSPAAEKDVDADGSCWIISPLRLFRKMNPAVNPSITLLHLVANKTRRDFLVQAASEFNYSCSLAGVLDFAGKASNQELKTFREFSQVLKTLDGVRLEYSTLAEAVRQVGQNGSLNIEGIIRLSAQRQNGIIRQYLRNNESQLRETDAQRISGLLEMQNGISLNAQNMEGLLVYQALFDAYTTGFAGYELEDDIRSMQFTVPSKLRQLYGLSDVRDKVHVVAESISDTLLPVGDGGSVFLRMFDYCKEKGFSLQSLEGIASHAEGYKSKYFAFLKRAGIGYTVMNNNPDSLVQLEQFEHLGAAVALMKHSILPTPVLARHVSDAVDSSNTGLLDARIKELMKLKELTDAGKFDPQDILQRDMEFIDYLKLSGQAAGTSEYKDFVNLPFDDTDPKSLQTLGQLRKSPNEIDAAAFEAAALYRQIVQLRESAARIGKKLVVVGEKTYGYEFVVRPMLPELDNLGVEVRSAKVGSSNASRDTYLAPEIFTPAFQSRIAREKPVLIVVDGTYNFHSRFPSSSLGYLNYIIAVNDALSNGKEELYAELMGVQHSHVELLKSTQGFKELRQRLEDLVSPTEDKSQLYKVMHLHSDAGSAIKYGNLLQTQFKPVNEITQPTLILANSVLPPGKLPPKLQNHIPCYFDDNSENTALFFSSHGVKAVDIHETLEKAVRWHIQLANGPGHGLLS